MGAKRFIDGAWHSLEDRVTIHAPPVRDEMAELLEPMSAAEVVDWIGTDVDRAQKAWSIESRRDHPRKTVQRHVISLVVEVR